MKSSNEELLALIEAYGDACCAVAYYETRDDAGIVEAEDIKVRDEGTKKKSLLMAEIKDEITILCGRKQNVY